LKPRRACAAVARRLLPAAALGGALAAAATALAGAAAPERYGPEDFARVEKIDAHVHLHGSAERFMAQAAADGFRVLTINVDYPDFESIDLQQRDALELLRRYPGRVAFAATFPVAGFEEPGWAERTNARIDAAIAQGAVGVKVWKNIGMQLRDRDGRYVQIDDRRLAPVFDHLQATGTVLLGHQAEPLNCWLPFEQMTVRSDREYFREHPQYYMAAHPEMPSHELQLAARDRMLAAHPRLAFDAVHLASLEWDVDEVARFLDRFPEASVDLAARMVHLEVQAVRRRAKVRDFLLRYQDRILYGSDIAHGPGSTDAGVAAEADEAWRRDWRFLNTDDEMHSEDFDGSFRGLALPREVVDKLYRLNARRLFPSAWQDPH
jgi:predicted TIM-barrel fold metal-dependent hydrolase